MVLWTVIHEKQPKKIFIGVIYTYIIRKCADVSSPVFIIGF